jgi:hypothetical protein
MFAPQGYQTQTVLVPVTYRVTMIDVSDTDMVNTIETCEFPQSEVLNMQGAINAVEMYQACYSDFSPERPWQIASEGNRAIWQHDGVLIIIIVD